MRGSLSLSAALTTLIVGAVAQADGPDAARKEALAGLLAQDCGSCHGMTMKGGLGPPLLPEALVDKDDDVLVEAILDGRPGTPMPPWRFELTPEEAAWLVAALREGRR